MAAVVMVVVVGVPGAVVVVAVAECGVAAGVVDYRTYQAMWRVVGVVGPHIITVAPLVASHH